MAKAKAQPTFLKYGIKWKVGVSPLAIEFYCIRNHVAWGLNLFQHYVNAQALLWPNLQHHRWSNLILKTILEERVTIVTGPKDCVAGHTRILNPITGEQPTIQELYEKQIAPTVMTLDGPAVAEVPFLKGEAELFEVTCYDGSRFTATARHVVLTDCGWVDNKDVRAGTRLVGYERVQPSTTSAFCPSAPQPNAFRLNNRVPNFLVDYRDVSDFCDEPLRMAEETGQSIFPSQADAPEHISCYRHMDGTDYGQGHTPIYQDSDRLSISDYLPQKSSGSNLFGFRFSPKTISHGAYSYARHAQFLKASRLSAQPSSEPSLDLSRKHSLGNYKVRVKVVKSIKSIGIGKFYDITVPEIHHYFAEGTIHHNTGKTHVALARFGLTDYFAYPNNTLILVSSTELRGLETRIWGELKMMFSQAKERWPWLPGKVVDHMHGLFTDDLGENCDVRDIRKGILCVPCVGGSGEWVGIEKFCGIKQERRRLLADELQFMKAPYLTSVEHLDKGDFKMVGCNNPIGMGDPADKMSEPIEGWGTEPQSEKTETWRNKWGGVTINLDGRDSPNNDEPKNSYSYLINEDDIQRTLKRCGPDSSAFWTQVIGKRKVGLLEHRVLTYAMCKTFKAFDDVIWKGVEGRFKVYGIDASYGGDRCVGGWAEVGQDINDVWVVSFNEPVLIPIKMSELEKKIAEDQIAEFVRKDCEQNMILPENVFFDATGRGSLGTSFGRLWSAMVNPVEFGGTPTPRPVAGDMFILDPKTKQRRLKRCDEHYSKRVTEYWFSVRYLVESGQCRNMPKEVAEEFGMREWYPVKGDRKELEIKEETKTRMGCSPDLADWACIVVEGARRRGFSIKHGEFVLNKKSAETWKNDLRKRMEKIRSRYELNYSA